MKKFAVTAGLIAACAAGTFGTAAADDDQGVVVGVDPAGACAFYHLTPEQCQQALQPGVGMTVQGQAWTGYNVGVH
ncbi:hypothetical protein [Nocardia seriolae]|uniref:Uncharacterized protein n=1 Tax=Nocardia seriolae TaxID=37332 RepID=A0A0B8NE78_9NOCA|nr:hypothetical protein [Nocardia seriolae]APA96214.1 hypothetical protein NS506_02147 [Nocardia seriolae]MTJ65711.1 hypothetical protein [Nocardia seriolae]MTJ71639.1 hypothetical protein [Nocardia seriolae]MTJ86356.1 hypothetical protein [Nocardia seriolae]MTK30350.1 hypothetical protein [Nocardia seriolae]